MPIERKHYNSFFFINQEKKIFFTKKNLEKEETIIEVETKLKEEDVSGQKTISEMLREQADQIKFDEDFLINDDEYDVPNMESSEFIEESEDKQYTISKYFGEELLNIGGFDVKLADILVLNPNKDNKKERNNNKKEGVGYMLTRLKCFETYFMNQLFFEQNISKTPIYMTLGNYLKSLEQITQLYEYYFTIEDENALFILSLCLYKQLCQTFITKSETIHDIKDFYVENRNLIYCVKVLKEDISDEHLKVLEKKKNDIICGG